MQIRGHGSVGQKTLVIEGPSITSSVLEEKVWEFIIPDPRLRNDLRSHPVNYQVVENDREERRGVVASATTYQAGGSVLWLGVNGSKRDTEIIVEFDAVLVVAGSDPLVRKARAIYPRYAN